MSATDAVLVPVIVTQGGQFVRGLKEQDFEILEDGVKQSIASMASEDAPLDLVLAVDVSGSMERSLDEVKPAVKQLLSKLRPGDAATLVGFNDTMFLAAEREKDQHARERAVDLLTAWGGTALYDATVRAIDLVSRDWGRKGIVIFSDGDDRNSLTSREAATARVQASDAMLYTVGFGAGATVPDLQARLETYAKATGGRAFFPQRTQELDGVFDQIVAELANQYLLSYSSTNAQQDNTWRAIKVRVRNGKYDIRARKATGRRGPNDRGGNHAQSQSASFRHGGHAGDGLRQPGAGGRRSRPARSDAVVPERRRGRHRRRRRRRQAGATLARPHAGRLRRHRRGAAAPGRHRGVRRAAGRPTGGAPRPEARAGQHQRRAAAPAACSRSSSTRTRSTSAARGASPRPPRRSSRGSRSPIGPR